ncbi:hypothetical protein [Photobacterium sp.]|uniref:hypothetical protein n=1 Tax=Photobacterium sp. TaxID=660 RepID=UPI00299D7493|nr:hypothetical protein [Photobacterium sp.]MDX1304383.1 hypothetical protein [Photobacterium sp.]
MKIAFLHTLSSNINLFKPYINQYLSNTDRSFTVEVNHHLHEELLKEAMTTGITPELRNNVIRSIETIAKQGVDVIVCTCSTIGAMAEETQINGCRILRVDRPMAEATVQYQRVLVLAAVASTLDPSLNLLEQVRGSHSTHIDSALVPDAWAFYFAEDYENYARTIARYISTIEAKYDVIMLAQASMTPAVAYCQPSSASILTSPETCLQYLLHQVINNA